MPRAVAKHPPGPPCPHPSTQGWGARLYLGGDDEQGGLRVQGGQGFGNVGPINVGDKPDPRTS